MFVNLGLCISLGLTILAFEWKSYDDATLLDLGQVEADFEDIMEIPPTEQPPPPPPKHTHSSSRRTGLTATRNR